MTESDDETDDAIGRLAAKHGIDRDQAADLVQDLQAEAESPIVCEECRQSADPDEGRYIGRVRLTDGETGVRCTECYADMLVDETLLSGRESEVVAYTELTDLKHREIGEIIDMGRENVGSYRSKAMKKRDKALAQLEEAEKTLIALEEL